MHAIAIQATLHAPLTLDRMLNRSWAASSLRAESIMPCSSHVCTLQQQEHCKTTMVLFAITLALMY
jgi:hypothetical protein